jgi:hypothetical protein
MPSRVSRMLLYTKLAGEGRGVSDTRQRCRDRAGTLAGRTDAHGPRVAMPAGMHDGAGGRGESHLLGLNSPSPSREQKPGRGQRKGGWTGAETRGGAYMVELCSEVVMGWG